MSTNKGPNQIVAAVVDFPESEDGDDFADNHEDKQPLDSVADCVEAAAQQRSQDPGRCAAVAALLTLLVILCLFQTPWVYKRTVESISYTSFMRDLGDPGDIVSVFTSPPMACESEYLPWDKDKDDFPYLQPGDVSTQKHLPIPKILNLEYLQVNINESEKVCHSIDECFDLLINNKTSEHGLQYYFASCTITRNSPIIVESLIRLFAYGVQHAFIWDNYHSANDTNVTLALKGIPLQFYTIIDFPAPKGRGINIEAYYKQCLEVTSPYADWITLFDDDIGFYMPRAGVHGVTDFLSNIETNRFCGHNLPWHDVLLPPLLYPTFQAVYEMYTQTCVGGGINCIGHTPELASISQHGMKCKKEGMGASGVKHGSHKPLDHFDLTLMHYRARTIYEFLVKKAQSYANQKMFGGTYNYICPVVFNASFAEDYRLLVDSVLSALKPKLYFRHPFGLSRDRSAKDKSLFYYIYNRVELQHDWCEDVYIEFSNMRELNNSQEYQSGFGYFVTAGFENGQLGCWRRVGCELSSCWCE